MSIFGDRLKAIIEKKGLTQSELADSAHTTNANISRYINSERLPNVEVAAAIAMALDVSVDFLMGRTDDPTRYAFTMADIENETPGVIVAEFRRRGIIGPDEDLTEEQFERFMAVARAMFGTGPEDNMFRDE